MAQMLLRPPDDLKKALQEEAQRIGITLNALALQILRSWADQNLTDE